MKYNPIKVYEDYIKRLGNRKELYNTIAKKFEIKSAIYPGSHVDVTPSFFIPKVVYIDSFKGTIRFFKYTDEIKEYLNQHKQYNEDCDFSFIGQDYTQPMDIPICDLIISQYAGFVGQATKQYLRIGGLLLCNDSHGDATLARFDDDFELVGVVDESNKVKDTNLKEYFVLPQNRIVDLNVVKKNMKGLLYTLTSENYLFQKVT